MKILKIHLTRFLFAWMGDWSCSQKVLCGKPRRILYAIGVLGVSVIMIFNQTEQIFPFLQFYTVAFQIIGDIQ